jgi:hypothetical protein
MPKSILLSRAASLLIVTSLVSFLLFDIGLIRAATTTSLLIYPTAGNDGSIRHRGGNWDSVRNASIGSQVRVGRTEYNIGTSYTSQSAGPDIYQIIRGFVSFNTALIPDDAIVSSSTLYIIPNGRAVQSTDEYSYIGLTGPVNLASSPQLTLGDFDQAGTVDNPPFLSNRKVTMSDPWISTQPVPFSLNTVGLQNIKKDGYSSFAFREGHDIENIAPSPLNASTDDWYIGATHAFTTPWTRPYLVVEYSLPPENSAPVISVSASSSVNESQPLIFTLSATDPDNNPITYSATNLPTGAALNPTTGEFTWTPDFNEAGTYQVTFTATENTPEALSDSETVIITVNNTNRAPELTPIGNQTINEGGILQFTVLATDPDNDSVVLSANNLPTGATFTPSTGIFYWNTNFDDAGNYPDIEFTATDNGTPMELDVELITITVGNVNRMPEITNPGPQQVLEGDSLSFGVSATDPDNDTVTLSDTNLPSGATFNPLNGIFSWTPSLSDAGVYTVTVTATDNGTPTESASTEVVITVGDNPTPTEQAEDLIETVITIDIPQNVENSYLANLQKVGQFILEGKITAALNQLNAFLNKVQQDYNQNILTQEEYESLTEAAENLVDDLSN